MDMLLSHGWYPTFHMPKLWSLCTDYKMVHAHRTIPNVIEGEYDLRRPFEQA
jgi:hypothetical protein